MKNVDLDPLTYLIDYVFEELPEGAELKYIDAQKIFYLTQQRLDADNRVAQSLPFYWYIHGPMSKAVSYSLNTAKQEGIIDGQTTPTAGQVYTPGQAAPPEIEEDGDLERAKEAIDEVLEEYDIFSDLDERLRDDIYVDAPYNFQLYYKFEVLPAIEEFAGEHYIVTHPPDEIQFRLARAEAKFPTDPAFNECSHLFSRFITLAETYLEEVDESEKAAVETFEQLANDAWELFAKRLRIEEHDDAYDDDIDSWKLEYNSSLQSFDSDLRSFEVTLNEQYDLYDDPSEESVRVSEDSAWGVVNSSLLEENRPE